MQQVGQPGPEAADTVTSGRLTTSRQHEQGINTKSKVRTCTEGGSFGTVTSTVVARSQKRKLIYTGGFSEKQTSKLQA